jgi:trimethylamine--corrinoid protein Co-methyltransferase
LTVLSDEQTQELHEATLQLLERVGVVVSHPTAQELLADAGAQLQDDRARIPPSLVERALQTAPTRVILSTRDGEEALRLEASEFYFGCQADCPTYLDPHSGIRRPFNLQDVTATAVINDYCSNIDFVAFSGLAADVPAEIAARVVFRQLLNNTTKSISVSANDAAELKDILEMAAIVAGGYQELRRKPFIAIFCGPITPLVHPEVALDQLLMCAEEEIPVIYSGIQGLGATAPCTLAGAIATANAECLSGLVIHQLKNPGAPFIFGSSPTVMDMRTSSLCSAAPETTLTVAALIQLAHRYQLPTSGSAGLADSHEIDLQAGVEAAISCFSGATSGANLIHNIGMLGSSTIISPEYIVLGNEIVAMTKRIMQGIPIDEENLALDVLDSVGPGGEFVTQEHTLRHFRSIWYPDLFDRSRPEARPMGSRLDLRERVSEKTQQILQNHRCAPLPEGVKQELDAFKEKWAST